MSLCEHTFTLPVIVQGMPASDVSALRTYEESRESDRALQMLVRAQPALQYQLR